MSGESQSGRKRRWGEEPSKEESKKLVDVGCLEDGQRQDDNGSGKGHDNSDENPEEELGARAGGGDRVRGRELVGAAGATVLGRGGILVEAGAESNAEG